jgi:hypothetical protein
VNSIGAVMIFGGDSPHNGPAVNAGSYNSNPNSRGFFLDAGAYSWNGGADGSCCTCSLALSANEIGSKRSIPSETGGYSGEPTDSNLGPKTSVPSETDEPPPQANPPAANHGAINHGIVNLNISSVSLLRSAIENRVSDIKRNKNDPFVLIVGRWTKQKEINNSGYNDKLKGIVGELGFVRKSENRKRY